MPPVPTKRETKQLLPKDHPHNQNEHYIERKNANSRPKYSEEQLKSNFLLEADDIAYLNSRNNICSKNNGQEPTKKRDAYHGKKSDGQTAFYTQLIEKGFVQKEANEKEFQKQLNELKGQCSSLTKKVQELTYKQASRPSRAEGAGQTHARSSLETAASKITVPEWLALFESLRNNVESGRTVILDLQESVVFLCRMVSLSSKNVVDTALEKAMIKAIGTSQTSHEVFTTWIEASIAPKLVSSATDQGHANGQPSPPSTNGTTPNATHNEFQKQGSRAQNMSAGSEEVAGEEVVVSQQQDSSADKKPLQSTRPIHTSSDVPPRKKVLQVRVSNSASSGSAHEDSNTPVRQTVDQERAKITTLGKRGRVEENGSDLAPPAFRLEKSRFGRI